MKCKTLIVDDEQLARMRMRSLLERYPEDIEIVGEAETAAQAKEKIKELNPDLLFLDIQMPDQDAFEMLAGVEESFSIVFTTAFDDYALRSFDEDVIDYLLKPIEEERLEKTIEKIRAHCLQNASSLTVDSLPADFSWQSLKTAISQATANYLQRIQVKIGDRILLVNVDEIIRFKSEDKYTVIYTPTMQYIIDTPLIDLEKKLDPKQFVRVHRAHIVAIDYIAEMKRLDVGRLCIILRDKMKTQITVSRNFVKRVRSL